jgi:NAD(P)-dependent dehydrogenase (short-subunit alcohol dehydrogenase family)
MPGPLGGKVALVTGAASGIGRATALAFAQEGAKVVVSARSIDQGEETVACIRSSGGDATFVRADVTIASEVAGLVQTAVAGVSGTGFLPHKYPDDLWDRNIGVNLTGVWLCLKYEVRQMLRQGSGAIVNTSSVGGLIGVPLSVGYSASKHGVIGLTKSAALAYAQNGIRVNAVCPGYVRTPMLEAIMAQRPGYEAAVVATEPVGRLGSPEEVAGLVVWLCTDAASFMTGVALPVDGGFTAR